MNYCRTLRDITVVVMKAYQSLTTQFCDCNFANYIVQNIDKASVNDLCDIYMVPGVSVVSHFKK